MMTILIKHKLHLGWEIRKIIIIDIYLYMCDTIYVQRKYKQGRFYEEHCIIR